MINKLFTPFSIVDKKIILASTFLQIVIGLIIWSIIPSQIIPNPLEIFEAWNKLALQSGLIVELFKSLGTIWKAILYSTGISLVLAYIAIIPFFKSISRMLTVLRFLGFAGITFLFTMWTSNGSDLMVALLTFGMTVFLLTNMLSLVEDIKGESIDYARTLGLPTWKIIYEVGFRDKLADLIDLVRQNLAIGWMMLSMVEGLVRTNGGIGSLLLNQDKHFHLASVFAIQLTILIIGIFQDLLFREIRLFFCPYLEFETKKA